MFERTSGASEGRGAVRGKARGPVVGAKRRLPGPGKAKVTSAGGSRLSPRSGRQARPGGVKGAPAGRTGAGVNRPSGRPRNAAPAGDCNREGGRGNTEAAAVHKAGEERRFGATPATATPLTSSLTLGPGERSNRAGGAWPLTGCHRQPESETMESANDVTGRRAGGTPAENALAVTPTAARPVP